MKKLFVFALCVAAVSVVLSSCSSKNNDSSLSGISTESPAIASTQASNATVSPPANLVQTETSVPTNSNGSSNPISRVAVTTDIPFEYFYRGFTAVKENDTGFPVGISVIQDDESWHSFMDKYCRGIPYYIGVDYTKECLIVNAMPQTRSCYNMSFDIKSITMDNFKINMEGEF